MFRVLWIAYIVRHTLSLIVLAYLTYMAFASHSGNFRLVMIAISAAFLAFAAYQGAKIRSMYRRSVRRAASDRIS